MAVRPLPGGETLVSAGLLAKGPERPAYCRRSVGCLADDPPFREFIPD
jgi:hypothetical protein